MPTTIDKVIHLIKHHASFELRQDDDDFNPYDYSGGNFDDAFQMGVSDGYILFAQELLRILNDNSSN